MPQFGSISAQELSELLLARKPNEFNVAVVDVRDYDFECGHIKGCLHLEHRFVAENVRSVVQMLSKYKKIVFHCMFSQSRGPMCATRFFAELMRRAPASDTQVLVLVGGFNDFARAFGDDPRLVADLSLASLEAYTV